ncbi:MAG: HYR domain-containing protein [Bacteroidetes bacterium]|nr:HYR domain-containing protein [Bacteroidota bacterium]
MTRDAGNETINLSGNFSLISGSFTRRTGTTGIARVNFAKAGTQNYIKSGGSITNAINFVVNSGSTLNMSANILDGSTGTFTLSSGGGLILGDANGITSATIGATGGNIRVTGTRTYDIGGNYEYNGTINQATGNGLPGTVNNLIITNSALNGIVTLTSTTSLDGALMLNSGVLSLGTNNLSVNNGAIVGGAAFSATNMVATGTGRFIRYFSAGNSAPFVFPVGDITATAEYSPVMLDFSASDNPGTIGINVTGAVHPSINSGSTASSYLSRYWTFTTTGLTNYTYIASTYQYPTSDVTGTETDMKLSFWNGSAWTTVDGSNAGGNQLSITSSLDNATGKLDGNEFTGRISGCVSDLVNPTVTCPSNITQNNIAGSCNAVIAVPDATYGDNCGVTILTWDMSGATTGTSLATGINQIGTKTFNVGVTTITYTAYDAAGNSSTCSFTVTVVDAELPLISCPANYNQNVSAGTCAASIVTSKSYYQ